MNADSLGYHLPCMTLLLQLGHQVFVLVVALVFKQIKTAFGRPFQVQVVWGASGDLQGSRGLHNLWCAAAHPLMGVKPEQTSSPWRGKICPLTGSNDRPCHCVNGAMHRNYE